MRTNLEMLDKIVDLNKTQLLMVCGKNDIEKIFNINLLSTIALEQQESTAIFYNIKNEILQDTTSIHDKIISNYYHIDIQEISNYRLAESCNVSEDYSWTQNEYVYLDGGDLKLKLPNKENQDKLKYGYKEMEKSNLYINALETITLEDLKTKCRNLKQENDVKLIVINDLEIIKTSNVIAVKELKQLSIELDIVIIVSFPIKLNLEIPLEKQLRDTERIVKNSDIVIYINKPNTKLEEIIEIVIAKNNGGKTGIIEVAYIDKYCKICNLVKIWNKKE